jgi:hypothetical protein
VNRSLPSPFCTFGKAREAGLVEYPAQVGHLGAGEVAGAVNDAGAQPGDGESAVSRTNSRSDMPTRPPWRPKSTSILAAFGRALAGDERGGLSTVAGELGVGSVGEENGGGADDVDPRLPVHPETDRAATIDSTMTARRIVRL